MKVLFLDHDGVICLSSEWGSRALKKGDGIDKRFDNFNSKALEILNEIIEITNCEIVISSDWRHYATLEELQELYKIRGIRKLPIDITSYISCSGSQLEKARVEEINDFLSLHPEIIKWVAVDDLDLSELENFIRTPLSSEGIKQTGIKDKIIKALQ
jgi:hypothetical protein